MDPQSHAVFPPGRSKFVFLSILVIAAWCGMAPTSVLAQTVRKLAPGPDPLKFLLSDENHKLDPGRIRLSLGLLRIPTQVFAEAMAQQEDGDSQSWHRWLEKARADKKLTLVTTEDAETGPGQEFREGYTKPYRFVQQGESSQLWDDIQRDGSTQLSPQLWGNLVQNLSEERVGTQMNGTIHVAPDRGAAHLDLTFLHVDEPTLRPAAVWKHALFDTPRAIFRPWSVYAQTVAPLDSPFLVAAQVEPSDGGDPNNTASHVLALFGKITYVPNPESKRAPTFTPERLNSAGVLQSWTLDLPKTQFQDWLLNRTSNEHDEPRLRGWLAMAFLRPEDPASPRLLHVASLATSTGGGPNWVAGELRWNDPAGFEPSGNSRIFRPLVSEDSPYIVHHRLEASMLFPAGPPNDPNLRMGAELKLEAPGGPLRWQRWKHAMEGREEEPDNLELADKGLYGLQGLSLNTELTWVPGKSVLTAAALRGDRVHAVFTQYLGRSFQELKERPTQGQALPAFAEGVSPPPGPAFQATLWRIETPLSWTDKLLVAGPEQATPLAAELFKAVESGQAKLSTLSTQSLRLAKNSSSKIGTPVNFYGGSYVNTASHAGGIYFNMRMMGQRFTGEEVELAVQKFNADGVEVAMTLQSTGEPVWRHWGVWQPGVAGTNATNSGLRRPQFRVSNLAAQLRLPLNQPQVVAVEPVREPSSPGGPLTGLRWCVLRMSVEENPPPPVPPSEAGNEIVPRRSTRFQLLVLKLPASETVPPSTESQELAQRLLGEVKAGARPVLDVLSVFRPGTAGPGYGFSISSGTEYYFMDPRGQSGDREKKASLLALAVMPQGTPFSEQIYFEDHVVGLELKLSERNWDLTRDKAPPQVVTDTFTDVRYEFPYVRSPDKRRTTVSVERPVFQMASIYGRHLKAGEASVTRLNEDTVVVVSEVGP